MKMMNFARGAVGAAALLLGLAQARADYSVNPATASNPLTVCGFSVTSVLLPCHVMVNSSKQEIFTVTKPGMVGLTFGGAALSLGQATAAQSLPVVLPSNPDILNAAATLTAADAASTSAAGQNGVSIVSGTPTAGSIYAVAVNGQSEADFAITGSFVGTLVFEGSANNGATWTPRSAHVMGTKYRQTQVTGPGVFHINAAGLTNIRVRAAALTSGTPSIQLNTTTGTGSIYVMNDLELVDYATGLSPTVKQAGTATTSDNGLVVQNPVEAAALGTPADPLYNGSNTATQIALLKAAVANLSTIVNQAAPTGAVGATPPNGTLIPWIQLVPGAQPQPVDTVIRITATARSLILPVQEASDTVAAAGSGGTTGDILTLVGGTLTPANAATGVAAGTPAKCTATYSSGALTSCVPLAGSLGSYTVLPTNPVATTSSGAGTGATLNVSWTGLAIPLAPANTSRRGLHVQPQGGIAYLRGAGVLATADYNALKINADALYETSPAFVGTGALSMITGGTVPLPVYAAEF